MSSDTIRVSLLLVLPLAALHLNAAVANETTLKLKDGPELVKVRAYCSMCHSLDYIVMNSPFLNRAGWEAEVRKMVKTMGAPIPDEEIAPIVEYLNRNYGVTD